MNKFGRTFDLKLLTDPQPDWWRDLLARWTPSGSSSPSGLRLALRNNYLSFYIQGQLAGEVRKDIHGNPYLRVHAKYVDPAYEAQDYKKFSANSRLDLDAVIARATDFAGCEKRLVDWLVATNANIIDLEMALPAIYGDDRSAKRIDLVALEANGDRISLVVVEVKLIDDSRLASIPSSRPKVVDQIEDYKKVLSRADAVAHITAAYVKTCQEMVELHNHASRLNPKIEPLSELIRWVGGPDGRLDIDPVPRLLVYSKNEKCKVSPSRIAHLDRLIGEFGIQLQTVYGAAPLHFDCPTKDVA